MSDQTLCAAGDAAACQRYYASYSQLPNVVQVPVTHDDNLQPMIATGPGVCSAVYGAENAKLGGCCPMCPDGTCPPPGTPCGSPGSPDIGCLNLRECEGVTGARHFEYAVAGGNVTNADVWSIDPVSGAAVWLGPTGAPATPPSWAPPNPKLVNGAVQYAVGATAGGNQVLAGQAGGYQFIGAAPGTAYLQPMHYDPSSGWQVALQTPPETQPGIPATTTVTTRGTVGTAAAATASGTGPTQGGTRRAGTVPVAVSTSHNTVLMWSLAALAVFLLL